MKMGKNSKKSQFVTEMEAFFNIETMQRLTEEQFAFYDKYIKERRRKKKRLHQSQYYQMVGDWMKEGMSNESLQS